MTDERMQLAGLLERAACVSVGLAFIVGSVMGLTMRP